MYCFRPQMSGVAFTVSMVGGGGGRRVEILAVTHAGPPDCCSGARPREPVKRVCFEKQ